MPSSARVADAVLVLLLVVLAIAAADQVDFNADAGPGHHAPVERPVAPVHLRGR